jgi:hypothetical protein
MSSFFRELKQRKVYRVAVGYAVVAWAFELKRGVIEKAAEPTRIRNAIDYAKFRSRSCNAVIRVYDEAGKVIETHERSADFKDYPNRASRISIKANSRACLFLALSLFLRGVS